MLVVGLESRRPAGEKGLRRLLVGVLGNVTAPVVIDFVIVEGYRPRAGCVGGLERGVRAVQCVASPVLVHRHRLASTCVLAHRRWVRFVFIDVVAEEGDEIQVLPGQVLVSGVKAVLKVLARGEGEAELTNSSVLWHRQAKMTNRTLFAPY